MEIVISEDPKSLGQKAGKLAAELIQKAIEEKGSANIILATGTSQFETLSHLISDKSIEWERVTMFHLDEYIGLSISHPASFRKYLKERFLEKVGQLKGYYLIDGQKDPHVETDRLSEIIDKHPIDVALVGIGENGHLAFNDPPADFDTKKPYLVVNLDEACRKQQLGEGWFPDFEAVPKQAISMSIHQIMQSKHIVCSVPDERKAEAVKNCVENQVSNLFPASILQRHPSCTLFLDKGAASRLSK
ncbi:glucosamine-6-phosphate deaminase [Pleomorphovibrio marinus]|uniref:glucosamine-6-phosphate deaminase n=1 Tax=Pleomorphovibrio marinus TaxID=2164132 RepID=UPI000E0C98EE|nr:glucosamine-6-phosphate deaminase [Pleomorphovibrio marinus]